MGSQQVVAPARPPQASKTPLNLRPLDFLVISKPHWASSKKFPDGDVGRATFGAMNRVSSTVNWRAASAAPSRHRMHLRQRRLPSGV